MVVAMAAMAHSQDKSVMVINNEAIVSGSWSEMKKTGGLNAVEIYCQRRAGLCVEVRMWDAPTTGKCKEVCGRVLESSSDALRILSWTSTTIVAEDAGSCRYLARTLVIHFVEGAMDGKGSATETMDNSAPAAKGRGCKEKPDPLMPQTWVLESQTPVGAR